jgi:DNA helicase II / ATP-dependent DNA helicase PcrA
LNEVQQSLFVDRHSTQSGLTACTDLQGAALRRYRDTQRYLSALDILREADLEEKELAGCSLLNGLDAYSSLLDERSYLDYSAILEGAVDVLTNDTALRGRLAERVKYVIVDEYQDVNPIQEAIVWSLHELGARICVVGDDDQTIYQWRGSDVENILTFGSRYPGVKRIPLEENFRSSEGIVETARTFIAQNTNRLQKEMKPTGAQANEVGDIIALSFGSVEEETLYIVETAKSLRGVAIREDLDERGISWSDMAVLKGQRGANNGPVQSGRDPVRRRRNDKPIRHGRSGGLPAALLLHGIAGRCGCRRHCAGLVKRRARSGPVYAAASHQQSGDCARFAERGG